MELYRKIKGKEMYQIIDRYTDTNNNDKFLLKEKNSEKFYVKKSDDFYCHFSRIPL